MIMIPFCTKEIKIDIDEEIEIYDDSDFEETLKMLDGAEKKVCKQALVSYVDRST